MNERMRNNCVIDDINATVRACACENDDEQRPVSDVEIL